MQGRNEAFARFNAHWQSISRWRHGTGREIAEGARRIVRLVEVENRFAILSRLRCVEKSTGRIGIATTGQVAEDEEQTLTQRIGLQFVTFATVFECDNTRRLRIEAKAFDDRAQIRNSRLVIQD